MDYQYFRWLLDETEWHERHPGSEGVAMIMYQYEFKWFIPNDDNRGIDGLTIRSKWYQENRSGAEEPVDYCSMLEMMLALAQRMENDILYDSSKGDRKAEWFWLMMRNCGLEDVCEQVSAEFRESGDGDGYSYGLSEMDEQLTVSILDSIVFREYDSSGFGGLFPTMTSGIDYRNVEIWDQMQGYLNEHHEII